MYTHRWRNPRPEKREIEIGRQADRQREGKLGRQDPRQTDMKIQQQLHAARERGTKAKGQRDSRIKEWGRALNQNAWLVCDKAGWRFGSA